MATRTLTDREIATILHGLRMIQETANGNQDCLAGCCDHFDEADELSDAEIDALCEQINLDSVTIPVAYPDAWGAGGWNDRSRDDAGAADPRNDRPNTDDDEEGGR